MCGVCQKRVSMSGISYYIPKILWDVITCPFHLYLLLAQASPYVANGWNPASPWASYQIREIEGCACAGKAGNVSHRHRIQRKPLVNDPGMHHGKCVTHVPWCMSRSLTRGGGESVPDIPGACATHHFTHLIRGPLRSLFVLYSLFCVATVDFCLAFKITSDDSNWFTPCNNKVPERHKVSHSSGEVNG